MRTQVLLVSFVLAGCATQQAVLPMPPDSEPAFPNASPQALRCHGGDAKACEIEGAELILGTTRPKDERAARGVLAHGCKLGSAMSCAGMGKLWKLGLGGPRDYRQAAQYYEISCKQGLKETCDALGYVALHIAMGNEGEADPVRARALVRVACDGGSQDFCVFAAMNEDQFVRAARQARAH